MVNPLYLIAIPLATAFLLVLLKKASKVFQISITNISLLISTIISGLWVYGFMMGNAQPLEVFTAGFGSDIALPLSINLLIGRNEAVILLIVNLSAFLSSVVLSKDLKKSTTYIQMLLLVSVVGLNGIVLTRDLFNLFVFIEIASISAAGLIAMKNSVEQLGAGFKFIIAGALASGLMLLGIIFNYYITGSLNIDTIASMPTPLVGTVGFIALFLIFIGMIIELKPFPINGWGVDIYEASEPAISALTSAATASAMFFAFTKILGMSGELFWQATATIGGITFVAMNIMALKQEKSRRLLGYSSISQVGLLALSYSLTKIFAIDNGEVIVFGLLVTHALAKAGFFWLAGVVKELNIKKWSLIRKSPFAMASMIIFVFALTGFPPFPSFFAKWELVMALATNGSFLFIGIILFGSLLEAVYLFRWLGYALKEAKDEEKQLDNSPSRIIPSVIYAAILLVLGFLYSSVNAIITIPILVVIAFGLIDFLDVKVKNTIALTIIGIYAYFVFPTFYGDLFKVVFGAIFMGGALLTLFSGYYFKGKRTGFYPAALSMFFGLFMLVQAETLLQFFYGWEFMAIGSYFLLIRGKKSAPHGFSYMLFSIGGSFAMLAGFSMAFASSGTLEIATALHHITVFPLVAYSLMLIGFMTKTATLGFHIWLPGAHGEAVADIHFMASAILLKAGVFGIILVLLGMDRSAQYSTQVLFVLGWLGVLSALIANANAAFQESAKRLLAWSSIGQLGYILFGLSSMSNIGWLIALSMSITHFLYKGILFLVIGGVSLKLGTPLMYKMGGLVKRMPFSFTAVLIAIITLSGVPPLVGYTGKWLAYNMVISSELYLQGVVVSIAGIIAFLYLFRLIFAIFLGQLKDEHSKIKEISAWFLVPVYTLIGYMVYVSFFPQTLLAPLGDKLMAIFPENPVLWTKSMGTTDLGYFDGTLTMYVFMGIFAVAAAVLFLTNRHNQKVRQFNIVYAAERPARPETTHFAYNFFAPYRRAVGILEYPLTTNFWGKINDYLHSIGGFVRQLYSGNGQTYLIQIVIFVVVALLLMVRGY